MEKYSRWRRSRIKLCVTCGFAALISYSGITDYLVGKIIASIHAENSRLSRVKVKIIIIIALLAMSIMSQNLIPVHIAFIPIVPSTCEFV